MLRSALYSVLTAFCLTQSGGGSPEPPQLSKLGEVGGVMNIDLSDSGFYRRHWEAIEGWGKFIRVSVAMEIEGYRPDVNRLKFTRIKTLAADAARRNLGMHIILGTLPGKGEANEWHKAIASASGYEGKRYKEMPEAWWPSYAKWQEKACQEIVRAYGPNAKDKVRFQLFNEPYDRGEDAVATKLMNYCLYRLLDGNGKIEGCPVDGPSLWGPAPQMMKQIDMFADLMRNYPDTFGRVERIPMNVYAPPGVHRSTQELTESYIANAKSMYAYATRTFKGRGVYFSEFGVSRVWDVRPEIFGERSNDAASNVLINTLKEVRKFVPQITIYQTQESNLASQKREAFGLIDAYGKYTIDMEALRRAARD